MQKQPGKIFEIIEGNYKDKFLEARNKHQLEHYLRQNKMVGILWEDYKMTKHIPHPENGKKMLTIIDINKLKLVGFID